MICETAPAASPEFEPSGVTETIGTFGHSQRNRHERHKRVAIQPEWTLGGFTPQPHGRRLPVDRPYEWSLDLLDFGLFRVERAIFHQVPSRGAETPPIRSTVESNLDDELEFFLRDRLGRTFGASAQPVRRGDPGASPVPDLVQGLLGASAPDIVVPFHPLPDLLQSVQAHNSPSGLLTIVFGRCGSTEVVAIAKIEEERGLSFSTEVNGDEVRVEVALENGLVLTDKTVVFKAAVFYLDSQGELQGFVTDDQAGNAYSRPASNYWLLDFLGCEFSNDVDVTTRDWVKSMKQVANNDLKDDPRSQSNLLAAIYTELNSNKANDDPKQFVADHIPLDKQDQALQRLSNNGAPLRRF